MDYCEQCAHYVTDEEFGDYCDVNLDEDEMEKFIANVRNRPQTELTAATVGSPRF